MAKKSKLLLALDAHKGRDYEAEKRKKQVKAAAKRTKQKKESLKQAGGVLTEADEDDSLRREIQQQLDDDFAAFSDSKPHEGDEDESDDESVIVQNGSSTTIPQPEPDAASASEAEVESAVSLSDLSEDDRQDTIPHQRLTINNGPALTASWKRVSVIKPKMPFQSHNSLISTLPSASSTIPDPNDDLTRELEFYRIAKEAATTAKALLTKAGIPFTRPADYFAEMVKSDEHMGRVKKKMYDEAAGKKASAEARAQRDAKKFGKKVQLAKDADRAREKRETLSKIKDLKRKRKGNDTGKVNEDDDLFQSIAVEEAPKTDRSGRERGGDDGDGGARPFKRLKSDKDKKFGFGGKKRFSKSGDATSSADMRGFSAGRMKGRGGARGGRGGRGGGRGGGGRGGATRPGKDRRAAAK